MHVEIGWMDGLCWLHYPPAKPIVVRHFKQPPCVRPVYLLSDWPEDLDIDTAEMEDDDFCDYYQDYCQARGLAVGSQIGDFHVLEVECDVDGVRLHGLGLGPPVHGFVVVEFSELYNQDEDVARRALITNAASPEQRVKRIRERYINAVVEPTRPPHEPPNEVQLGIVIAKFHWPFPHDWDRIPEWACGASICEGGFAAHEKQFAVKIEPIGYINEGRDPRELLVGYLKCFSELYVDFKKFLREEEEKREEKGELPQRDPTLGFVDPPGFRRDLPRIRRDEEYE